MPMQVPPSLRKIARYASLHFSVSLLVFFGAFRASTAERNQTKLDLLTLSTPGMAEISGGETRTFGFSITAGQYVHLSIEKGDLKLSAAVYDHENHKYIDVTSQHYAILEAAFISRLPGVYRIDICSLEQNKTPRHIEVKIDSMRPARAGDEKDLAAHRLLASVDRLRNEWNSNSLREAIRDLLTARSLWLSVKKWREAASASLSASEIYFALGEYRQSSLSVRDAALQFRKANDRLGEARAFTHAARVYSILWNNEEASRLCEKALEYYSALRERTSTLRQPYAEALNNAGEVYYATGDLVRASRSLEQALTMFTQVYNRDGEARSRLFLGYVSASTGDTAGAKKQFERSLQLSRETGNRMAEALSLAAIGTVHSQEGNQEPAIKMQRDAMDIFRRIGDRQSEAVTLNGLAQAYQFLNEHQAALEHYQQAFILFEENGSLDLASAGIYQIAKIHESEGDTKRAEEFYLKCFDLAKTARKKRMAAYALNALAVIHMSDARRRYRAAAELSGVLRYYEAINDRRGQALTLNDIGDFYLIVGKRFAALNSYKRALLLAQQTGDPGVKISTLYNIARGEQARDALSRALTAVKTAIEIIEQQRSNVRNRDFRVSYFSSHRKYYDLYIDLLMQLDQQQPGKGFAATALLASENARARSLCETLTGAAGIRQDAKTTIVNPRKLSIADIQSELRGDDTLLLEYALGNERSYLWSVTTDSIKGHVLPGRESLERAARDVYEIITSRLVSNDRIDAGYQARVHAADKQYFHKSLALSRMLLGPVAQELGSKRLLIVSEGMLQYLPFDALPNPDATTDLPGNSLISRHEVVNLPSMSALAAIRAFSRRPSSPAKTLAVFADPIVSDLDERLTAEQASLDIPVSIKVAAGDAARLSANGLVRLTHASDEADAIAAVAPWDTWVAKSFDASRENVLSDRLAEYRIVHFATHGIINTTHPELSSVVLSMAQADGKPKNGFLRLQNIYDLKLSADLTVLSACDTALGKDVKAEGLIGLTRGFMYAGSRSVVASLWKVDDRATSVLMKNFYRKMLNDRLPPAAALRAAKEIVRQEPAWKAPYYWAGFVIQGEYRNRIEVEPDRSRKSLFHFAALLFFVTTTFILIRRYRFTNQTE